MLWCLEEPRIDAGDATGKSEEDVAAGEVLLQKTDQEEAQEPDCAVSEGPGAEKEAAVNDEEAGFPKSEYEKRQTGDSPKQAGEQVGKHALATETVDRVGALLDLRHDPGDEEGHEERNGLREEPEGRGEPGAGFWGMKCARFVMTLAPLSTAAIRTMKMMRLQPARRPSVPMKILREGGWLCGSELGLVG